MLVVHRAEILLDWARGGDGGISSTARWQAELWRRLRDRLGVPSPAEQAREQDERLRRGGTDLALPARVSLLPVDSSNNQAQGEVRLPGGAGRT